MTPSDQPLPCYDTHLQTFRPPSHFMLNVGLVTAKFYHHSLDETDLEQQYVA